MEKKKLLFIFNPKSGKGQIKNRLMEILDIFVTVHPTQKKNDAMEVVISESENYDLLVCCGGDGTLDEVVNGMMNVAEQIPIGYIPSGSTNDFAQSLRIPKNMLKAADIAVNGRNYLCDIGTFNENYFVYIAAFGLFTTRQART